MSSAADSRDAGEPMSSSTTRRGADTASSGDVAGGGGANDASQPPSPRSPRSFARHYLQIITNGLAQRGASLADIPNIISSQAQALLGQPRRRVPIDENLPPIDKTYDILWYKKDDHADIMDHYNNSLRVAADEQMAVFPMGHAAGRYDEHVAPPADVLGGVVKRGNGESDEQYAVRQARSRDEARMKITNPQELANAVRSVVVIFSGDNDSPSLVGRIDPEFVNIGLGDQNHSMRATMYLWIKDSIFHLIFPKNCENYEKMHGPPTPPIDHDDAIGRPVFCIDDQGNVTDWNKYAVYLTKISKATAIGKHITELIVPNLRQAAGSAVELALQSQAVGTQHSSNFTFAINHHQHGDPNEKKTTGPLRIPMEIIRREGTEGLYCVAERRDGWGGVPFKIIPTPGNDKSTMKIAVHYREGGRKVFGIEMTTDEKQESMRRIREEFGDAANNLTKEVKTAESLECNEEEIVQRVLRCGGYKRYKLTGASKFESYTPSRQKFELKEKEKTWREDEERLHSRILNEQGIEDDNPASSFDKDSTDLKDVFNPFKVDAIEQNNEGVTGFTDSITPDYKTFMLHSSPRDIRNGEMASLSPEATKVVRGRIRWNLFGRSKRSWYQKDLLGRVCLQVPNEFPDSFKPRFMSGYERKGKYVYVHSGSGGECCLFGRYHWNRKPINGSLEYADGRRMHVMMIHQEDAKGHFQYVGTGESLGCKRLGNGTWAMPIYAAWEVDFNYYYGVEHATITKYFDRYNFCPPEVLDMNTFSAQAKFTFRDN